jgi:transcriptional regulator with XRE-family HTH domain
VPNQPHGDQPGSRTTQDDVTYRLKLGRQIDYWRRQRGMTTADLAERTGLSRGQVSRILNGRCSVKSTSLHRILRALGIDEAQLWSTAESPVLPVAHRDGADERQRGRLQIVSMLEYILREAPEQAIPIVELIGSTYAKLLAAQKGR